jgi:hypothetical protein
MTLTWKDAVATLASALAVLAFVITHEGWDVWLIGDHRRWAAAVVLVLGLAACSAGASKDGMARRDSAVLGGLAGVLGILAVITGSLTPLSLLVADIVVLWVITTYRHAAAGAPRSAAHA